MRADADRLIARLRSLAPYGEDYGLAAAALEAAEAQRDTLARMLAIDPPKWTHLPMLFDRDWRAWIALRDAALAGVAPPEEQP